jgi:hypothetical protein
MEPDAIPSISAGAVGSRFVTESDIDDAKARREEKWKAAYARSAATLAPPGQRGAQRHSCVRMQP